MQPLTEFPQRPFSVEIRVLGQVDSHLLETFDSRRDAALFFKNVTDHLVDERHRKLELNQKRVSVSIGLSRNAHLGSSEQCFARRPTN